MRLNALAMTHPMRPSTRFGQKYEDFDGCVSGAVFHSRGPLVFDSAPEPPATTIKLVKLSAPEAALAFMQSVVMDPLSQAERLLFARAYRVSIGLKPDDDVSLAANQRSAIDQYVELPLAERMRTLLGYWTQPTQVTVPVPYRKSGGYQD